jgi:hypothetical protein
VLLTLAVLAPTAVWADKELIHVNFAGGCPQDTITDENNCVGEAHEKDKSCRKPGEKVRWESTDGSEFSIVFDDSGVVNPSCRLASNPNGKVPPCDVIAQRGEHKYSVVTPACSLDPLIIIR